MGPVPTNLLASSGGGVSGPTFWVVGAAQFLAAHLVVESAWPRPYSWSRNFISDLGAVECGTFLGQDVCSPWHVWMNVSFAIQGVCLVAGLVLTASAWPDRRAWPAWRVLVCAAGAG